MFLGRDEIWPLKNYFKYNIYTYCEKYFYLNMSYIKILNVCILNVSSITFFFRLVS